MASFSAGKTALWLIVYFFMFFTVLTGVTSLSLHYGVDQNIHFDDNGFTSGEVGGVIYGNGSSGATSNVDADISTLKETIGLALGFNTSVTLGLPSAWAWLIRFFLVYLPGLALILSAIFSIVPTFNQ